MKLFITLFLAISLYSQMIDKIAIVVNEIPITTYEIDKTTKKIGNKKRAIDYLIDKAILKSAIKERGIYIDEFDIDKAMQKIATKNGMSLFNFKNYLLEQGKLENLKEKLKIELEQEKLLETLHISVSQNELKKYYQTHKNQFLSSKKIIVTKYSSYNQKELIKIINNPLTNSKEIEIKSLTFELNKTNPNLYQFLNSYKIGDFTKIINFENQPTTFYIEDKKEKVIIPFKMVANKIYNILMEKKSQTNLKNFIEKFKAKSEIKYLIKK